VVRILRVAGPYGVGRHTRNMAYCNFFVRYAIIIVSLSRSSAIIPIPTPLSFPGLEQTEDVDEALSATGSAPVPNETSALLRQGRNHVSGYICNLPYQMMGAYLYLSEASLSGANRLFPYSWTKLQGCCFPRHRSSSLLHQIFASNGLTIWMSRSLYRF
jgi:hypothetical protein